MGLSPPPSGFLTPNRDCKGVGLPPDSCGWAGPSQTPLISLPYKQHGGKARPGCSQVQGVENEYSWARPEPQPDGMTEGKEAPSGAGEPAREGHGCALRMSRVP